MGTITDEIMTKLLEWLLGFGVFTSVWASLLAVNLQWQVDNYWKTVVLPLPLFLVLAFGVYAATVVLWRVYNFNNCEEAAKELNEQIKEAKADLEKKGFKFS
ncbi:Dolichol-phosphate mannosyltransferase subunit 3 [Gryllus bimaculatus]|nr:Dolichol-phosphate mannosyltransferase subunit 3 [Gryllus bimaculatus]